MAALFDTSVAVLLMRRNPPTESRGLIRAAETEISTGSALLPAVAVTELLVGERTTRGAADLAVELARLPSVDLTPEVAAHAGSMGAFLRGVGHPIPLPDLLVAATAVWLELLLLAWDRDYALAVGVAASSSSTHAGAALLRRLQLHPASLGA